MTSTTSAATCQACNAPAAFVFDGVGYCYDHNPYKPVPVKERRAAEKAKREQERVDLSARLARQRRIAEIKTRVVDAARSWYVMGDFNEIEPILRAALMDLVGAELEDLNINQFGGDGSGT